MPLIQEQSLNHIELELRRISEAGPFRSGSETLVARVAWHRGLGLQILRTHVLAG